MIRQVTRREKGGKIVGSGGGDWKKHKEMKIKERRKSGCLNLVDRSAILSRG